MDIEQFPQDKLTHSDSHEPPDKCAPGDGTNFDGSTSTGDGTTTGNSAHVPSPAHARRFPLKVLDFAIVLLVLALAVLFLSRTPFSAADKILVTTQDAQYSYSLAQDGVYSVTGKLGETFFEIKDGSVRITDSPCPNKTCIAMGISDIIVCLPNGVMIQKVSVKKNALQKHSGEEIDGISR